MNSIIITVAPVGNDDGIDTGAIYGIIKAIVLQEFEEIEFMKWELKGEFKKQYAEDLKNALVNTGLFSVLVDYDGDEV